MEIIVPAQVVEQSYQDFKAQPKTLRGCKGGTKRHN